MPLAKDVVEAQVEQSRVAGSLLGGVEDRSRQRLLAPAVERSRADVEVAAQDRRPLGGARGGQVVGERVDPGQLARKIIVLQVLSVEPPRQIELEQVRDAIDSKLRREQRANALAEFESRLLAAAIIERGSSSAER